jgi:hypothetical protein
MTIELEDEARGGRVRGHAIPLSHDESCDRGRGFLYESTR